MNTQNIKTAASESSERWLERHEIKGISPALAEHLKYLKIWSEERTLARDREELLFGTLKNISEDICNTVTDWTIPRPVLPLSSVQAWARAREITLTLYGESGPEAWKAASRNLADCLAMGYASYVYDF